MRDNCEIFDTKKSLEQHFFQKHLFGKKKISTSESCFRVKLEEREFGKDLQSLGVLEYRSGTFDI